MYIPQFRSRQEKVAIVINKHGPITISQIKSMMPDLARAAVDSAVAKLRSYGVVEHIGVSGSRHCAYVLKEYLSNYYNNAEPDLSEVERKPKPLPVPPRTPKEFREMKGYTNSMQPHRDCDPLRLDIGFKNGSTDFNSRVGYRIF